MIKEKMNDFIKVAIRGYRGLWNFSELKLTPIRELLINIGVIGFALYIVFDLVL